MKQFLVLFTTFLFSTFLVVAQPDNAKVEVIDGKKFYVHIVEKGNTLYGIHRTYNTSIEDIVSANPGLSNNLELGQKVLIPIAVSDKRHYGIHIVKQGETLYGISKKYKCSVDDLKRLNQSLTDGISPGQEITVPKAEVTTNLGEVIQTDPVTNNNESVDQQDEIRVSLQDSIVMHKVLPHETMYSIAKRYMVTPDTIMAVNGKRNARIKKGDILKIPVKNVNYTVIEKDPSANIAIDSLEMNVSPTQFKEVYNIALLLPLMLDKNEQEMSRPLKLNQVRNLYKTTQISFDFYQGFLLAADSLAKAGLSVNIYVYDTKKDTTVIERIMAKNEFKTIDLVVGPLLRNTIKYTAKRCAEKQIRIVLPFNADSDVLHLNPYVYKAVASNMTLLDGTVDYLIENHKHHKIILIKPISGSDLALYERVRERFNSSIKSVSGAYSLSIVEANLGNAGGRELNALIDKDTTNIVIIPSTNLSFVSGAMNRLNKVMNMNPYAKKMKLIAFGLEEWNKFEDLDVKYRNRMNQHYASYRFVDYNDPEGVKFVRAFRAANGVDPNVYSSQGFDVGMYFMSALKLYGTNFDAALMEYEMSLVQNEFKFKRIESNSGNENQRVSIVKYNNFELVRLQ